MLTYNRRQRIHVVEKKAKMPVIIVEYLQFSYALTMAKQFYYTVYLRDTDEIIAFGNSSECAKMMHRSLSSFYCTVNRNTNGKHHKYTIVKEPFTLSSHEY